MVGGVATATFPHFKRKRRRLSVSCTVDISALSF